MNLTEVAQQFTAAYGELQQYTYQFIKGECLFHFGDAKSFSRNACDWMDKTADEMELWIVEHIVAKLAPAWPGAHTKDINDIIWSACHAHWKAA